MERPLGSCISSSLCWVMVLRSCIRLTVHQPGIRLILSKCRGPRRGFCCCWLFCDLLLGVSLITGRTASGWPGKVVGCGCLDLSSVFCSISKPLTGIVASGNFD